MKEPLQKLSLKVSAVVGTPESMKMREELLKKGTDIHSVAQSLAGVVTDEAEEFRKTYFTNPEPDSAKLYNRLRVYKRDRLPLLISTKKKTSRLTGSKNGLSGG